MTHFFDGKGYARKKEEELVLQVAQLKKSGITPKLVTILVGDNTVSKLYVDLKKKYAERVGVEIEIKRFQESESVNRLIELIKELNVDDKIHGIMVQLTLPKSFSENDRDEIINSIAPEKDVDGLRDDSLFTAPVVKVVLDIIGVAERFINHKNYPYKIVVVGASGSFGRNVIRSFSTLNPRVYRYLGVDKETKKLELKTKNADIVISATGQAGIIKADMVKNGVVLIDVGAPKGDIAKSAYSKATFVSPVPGGIGPAAIACLMENLVESAKKKYRN